VSRVVNRDLLKVFNQIDTRRINFNPAFVKPVIDKFFVTSQYLPRDIWCPGDDQTKWDNEMREAIERRFKIMTVEDSKLVPYDN